MCAFAPAALAHSMVYRVRFEIHKGQYMSSYSCLPGCVNYGGIHSFSESDENVVTSAAYHGMTIPSQGEAVKPGHPIAVRAADWDPDLAGNWRLAESYWTSDNPNTPVNCKGNLFNTDQKGPLLSSAPHNTRSELRLYIQSGETFQPKSVTGTHCDEANATHWHAFYPAVFEPPGDGYLPDMLTAHVSIPLGKIRNLHVGDTWGVSFHQDHAKRLPPSSCNNFTGSSGSCTQSLHWAGSVSVTRTG
jgi:hypothetical protein